MILFRSQLQTLKQSSIFSSLSDCSDSKSYLFISFSNDEYSTRNILFPICCIGDHDAGFCSAVFKLQWGLWTCCFIDRGQSLQQNYSLKFQPVMQPLTLVVVSLLNKKLLSTLDAGSAEITTKITNRSGLWDSASMFKCLLEYNLRNMSYADLFHGAILSIRTAFLMIILLGKSARLNHFKPLQIVG